MLQSQSGFFTANLDPAGWSLEDPLSRRLWKQIGLTLETHKGAVGRYFKRHGILNLLATWFRG